MRVVEKAMALTVVGKIVRHRFVKFGTVGFSGTIINLAVLYFGQEFLFRSIQPETRRLHASLSVAIFVATLSNFLLNRKWTWNDRRGKTAHGVLVQMGQYFLASGLAIGIQYVLTILFSLFVYYLLANIVSILIAAVFTYLLNDVWTFAIRGDLKS